jgi:hypothetical protein
MNKELEKAGVHISWVMKKKCLGMYIG